MGKSKFYLLSIGAMVALSVVAGSIFAASPEGSGGLGNKPAKQAGSGTVTAISGSMITIQGNKNSVVIDASNAKIITISTPMGAKPSVNDISLSDIKVGDTLRIQGTMKGNSVMATQIVDVTLGGGAAGGLQGGPDSQQGGKGGIPPELGGKDQNKPENSTKCIDDCTGVGRQCVSDIENGLSKKCAKDGQDCRTACGDQYPGDAAKARSCNDSQCRPPEVACYDKVVAQEAVCTTTKDQCVTACQKASKPQKPARPDLNGQQGPGGQNNCPSVGGGEGPGGQKGPGQPVGPVGPAGQMPKQQPPMSQEAETAITNKDFGAWVKAMTADGEMPAPLKVITKDNFPKFAEAHGYQLQAKDLTQKARGILQSLGITEGPGLGNDQGQGQ